MTNYEAGSEFRGYRLEALLGRGGFGTVWRASDLASGGRVAIKLLDTGGARGGTDPLRAEVELLAANAAAESPYVVRVLDGGSDPVPHIVMEYVDGESLAERLERDGAPTLVEGLRLSEAVARALGVLHGAAIVHRDVKPGNVMLDRDGRIRLTDFGVAKIIGLQTATATGSIPMSAAYAAPEVWEGHAGFASDVYAWGVLLFEVLAGEVPYGGTQVELLRQHLSDEASLDRLPRGTPTPLRELIGDCLAKPAADRPSIQDCAHRLRTIADEVDRADDGNIDLPMGPPRRFDRWVVRSTEDDAQFSYRCVDPATGATAVVEIHFSDEPEFGAALDRAVESNPRLVRLGAERLLGASRVVLRPGEAWDRPASGRLAYWLARDPADLGDPTAPLGEAQLRVAAAGVVALREAVEAAGLPFAPEPEDLSFDRELRPHLSRPGLPARSLQPEDPALMALARLPMTEGARDRLTTALTVDDLAQPPVLHFGQGTRALRRWATRLAVAALLVAVAGFASWFFVLRPAEPESSDLEDIAVFGGGAARTGVQPGPGPSGQPRVQWLKQTGAPVRSAIALDDDSLYLPDDHSLLALDNENGERRWTFSAAATLGAPVVTADGLVYVGDASGRLYAVDVDDGGQRWIFDSGAPITGAPVAADGLVFAGDQRGQVTALEALNGVVRWQFDAESAITGSLTAAAGDVYVGSEAGLVYALGATRGEERWQASLDGAPSQIAAADDGMLYAVGGGTLFALDAASGAERWTYDVGIGGAGAVIVVDGVVYAGGSDGRLWAVRADDGQPIWDFSSRGAFGAPAAVAAAGAGFRASMTPIAGDADSAPPGVLTLGLDREARQLTFSLNLDGVREATLADLHLGSAGEAGPAVLSLAEWLDPVDDAGIAGTLVEADLVGPLRGDFNGFVEALTAGRVYLDVHTVAHPSSELRGQVAPAATVTIYVGGEDGRLHAVDAVSGRELWTFQAGGAVAAPPIVVDGLIFVGSDDGHLYALGSNE